MSSTPIKRILRWIRIGVSVTILAVIGLIEVLGGYLYLTRSEAPDWLIRTAARIVESRAGAEVAFASVRIGPGTGLCSPGFDIAGIAVALGDPANRTRFSLGSLRWNGADGSIEGLRAEIPGAEGATVAELAEVKIGGGGFDVRGLRIGGEAPASGLAIEAVHAAPRSSGVTIRGLTQTPEPDSGGARIAVAEIDVSPIRSEGNPANFVIDQVAVRKVDFQAPFQQDAPPICDRLAGVFDPLQSIRDGARNAMERIEAGLASARRWLRIILIAAIAGFFLLKLVPAWDARTWWSRLALAAATVALPSVIYFLGRGRSGSLPLVCIGFACAAVMAVALYFGAYRRFSGWYHKGAAVALDLAGAVILPLFLLNGFVGSLDYQLPSGLRVERTTVEGISGELETAACDGLNKVRVKNARLEIEGVDAPITALLDGRPTIDIARIAFGAASGEAGPAVSIENPSGREVLELPELSAGILNFNASLDVEQRRYENIAARLQASGSVESQALREGVQRIRFLRNRAGELSTARFAVAANARGPLSVPPGRAGAAVLDSDAAHFSIDAAIGLDLAGCTLPVDADLSINTRDVKAAASLELRGENVDVRDLRSVAGSRLNFRGGTAHATIGDRLTVNGGIQQVTAGLESSELAVKSAKFDAAAPVGCSPSGAQTLAAVLAGIGFKTASGWSAGLDRATFSLDRQIGRAAGKIGAVTELHAVALSSTSQPAEGGPPNAPWLSADLPYTRLELAGTASGETLPRRIDGTIDALISRSASQPRQADNLALGADEPLRFSANLQAPEIDVPPQHNTFRQSIVSRELEPASLDFSFHAEAGQGGAPARLEANLLSDWISFATPSLPRHFELNEISKLTLNTDGKLNGFPLDEDLFRLDELPPLCRESVDLELNPFRVEVSLNPDGAGPLVRVHGRTGSEIRIRLSADGSTTEIGDSGLAVRTGRIERQTRKLSAPNARIEAVDLQLNVSGIQPVGGVADGPALALQADIARSAESFKISSSLTTGDGQSLLAFGFNRAGDKLDFALLDELAVDPLARSFEPFIQPLQCDLSWITPEVHIRKFAANAVLTDSELASADLSATLAPGSLFAVDLDAASGAGNGKPPAHLRKIQFAVDRASPLNVEATLAKAEGSTGGLNLKLNGDIPLKVDARGSNGEHHEATLDLKTEAVAALHSEEPAPSPILERGRKLFADLRRHAERAGRSFRGEQDEDNSPSLDLNWDLALRDAPAAKPFETRKGGAGAESDEVRSALAVDRANVTWKRAGQTDDGHFETSGSLAAASRVHQDYLVVEADSSLALDFSLDSQPNCSFNFQAPVVAAFRDRLEAGSLDTSLWNAAFYESFWASYKPAFPGRAFEPLVNCRNVTTGGVSILQVALPASPPRIAIGHSDHLQLNLPFAGSLLFGNADGLLQADIEWLDDHAAVSAAANLDLLSFQAAALGRRAIPGHLPFVEDEFNAKVRFLAHGIAVGRGGIRMQPAGLFEATDYPPFDLDLTLSRARPDGTLPGVLQATNRINLKLMNEFLDKVLAGVRLPAPPTALRYQGLDLNLAIKNGIIQTDPMFFSLRGVRLVATEPIEVGGDIRVHWKRDSWTLPAYKFSDFISSMQRFASAAPAE